VVISWTGLAGVLKEQESLELEIKLIPLNRPKPPIEQLVLDSGLILLL